MSTAAARPDIEAPFNDESAASPGETLGRFTAPRRSVSERKAAGKSLRKVVPRESHATFNESADRPDPVAILEAQNLSRAQKLVPVRFARMLASPFAFLRGSAAVMARTS